MSVIVSDGPSTVTPLQDVVEQIQAAYFPATGSQPLSDPLCRQALLTQLGLLAAELRDHGASAPAGELAELREELISYLDRLGLRLEALQWTRASATVVEREMCEFAELLYDFELVTSGDGEEPIA
jgi:hypothetical protein